MAESVRTLDLRHVEKQVAAKIDSLRQNALAAPEHAENWGNLAVNLDVHDFKQIAQLCYVRAIELDSTEFRWPYYYALLLQQLGSDRAIVWFERCRLLQPSHAPTRLRLGDAYLEQGMLDEAAHTFRQAVASDSGIARAWFGLSRVALQENRVEDAQMLASRAVVLDSTNREALGLLAEIERQLGNEMAAIRTFDRAQRLTVVTPIADSLLFEWENAGVSALWFRTRGERYLARADTMRAAEQFLGGLQHNPSAPGFLHVGELYEQIGENELAAKCFASAIEFNATFLPAFLKMASLALRMENYLEVLQWCDRGLHLNRAVAEFYQLKAQACLALDERGDAIAAYETGLLALPGQPLLMSGLAQTLILAPDVAFPDVERALALARQACERTRYQNPGTLEVLAQAYAAHGDSQKAVSTARAALGLAETANDAELVHRLRRQIALFRK